MASKLKFSILRFSSLPSTQDKAKELAEKGAPEGVVVTALRQTKGRGRHGRTWISPSGGLYFSMVLRPELPPKEALKLTLLSGVAVAQGIQKATGLRATVKWPNDVLIKEKKVCGILTETAVQDRDILYAVVGIGINVNEDPQKYAKDFLYAPTSLRRETGKKLSCSKLLNGVLTSFSENYVDFLNKGWKAVSHRWEKLSGTPGRFVMVRTSGGEICGQAEKINRDGFLVVREKDGKRRIITEGDVFHNGPL